MESTEVMDSETELKILKITSGLLVSFSLAAAGFILYEKSKDPDFFKANHESSRNQELIIDQQDMAP